MSRTSRSIASIISTGELSSSPSRRPSFLYLSFGPRPANGNVFLTAGKIRSHGNRTLADLPQAFPRFRRPRTVFDKFRFEIPKPKIFRFHHMNVGIDHFESLLGH